jgi:Asp-tRNA(Asn)/Glu-tRNA(Gln) amidotransferase B subunit
MHDYCNKTILGVSKMCKGKKLGKLDDITFQHIVSKIGYPDFFNSTLLDLGKFCENAAECNNKISQEICKKTITVKNYFLNITMLVKFSDLMKEGKITLELFETTCTKLINMNEVDEGLESEFACAMYSLRCFSSIVNREVLTNNSSEHLLKKMIQDLRKDSCYKKIKSFEQISINKGGG